MKYLIGENLKVKWMGEFVIANEAKSEFIFDTESEQQLNKGTLKGIAEANNVDVGSKDNVATLVEKIDQAFSKMNLKEINAMSDEKKVEEIVVAGVEAGKDQDTMLVEIVTAGISFKNAIKLFKRTMEAKGYAITAKKRKERIAELIKENNFKPETGEDVQSMVETITKSVPDTNEKQAMGVIRRWAKSEEIELPKVKKGKGVAGAGGFRGKAYAWMIENPTAAPEEFIRWAVDDQEKSETIAKRFAGLLEVAKKMAEKIIANDDVEQAA